MTSTYKVTAIKRIPKTEYRRYHVEIEVTRKVDDIFGERQYTLTYRIEVWQYAPDMFAWHICDRYGILHSGVEGFYGSLPATFHGAANMFRLKILNTQSQ